ncbi:bifunctional (p)ppGpp synthetase/guanosine-3',5'-bis(diphosphate) 3'-pyrophosphohydrolase [Chryseobacterium carnipullorum]|uniref:Bifunctional (P)ppGpp synthetase/guanosine-3',5'-bis(Diphosphate) 3'-pyrophosphohydrolase n=1 Tax=Chryseobacterium carnipullorum TaxID=1124835 RepID=A0A1M7JFD3_CHRCU|nr:RelA/SpoT family protein [Chryseobacterium carnipullorum]AZA50729.1 bifunctional (p)ppGpp synthetase/guanosine-3',5'-bis(diphosphate) 3'-pyrophosphohydrolase [Chryseobacterium carnipullorum]AZA65595.1 bifunctional (p)ppGpp synthetase/guanosine-3',5'-bis(diphosphate) 3'-pyrophosphohydrolase [Chryseobacterium carnipullorum]SHM51581.1 GTP pyrophosphokinase [Chryseobacterium carnipullorum]STD01625.1 GTP pyrophosphokinase [Chryseobacterium carnipullorum]HBV13883.1 bifunctional (p)ppGpp synthetas
MSYDLEQENKEILARYKDLISNTYRTLDEENNKLIRKAFDIALDAHKDQRRKSGEPYIYHPIAVAKIVATEIGLGATSIACALLHDVVEDSDYTYEDLKKIFGEKIANIVNGLTKISIMNHQNISVQSENYRKLLLTLSEDFRVILIKIADRLHNMRTLESMAPDKQKKIASETVYIYAPMAHRLGLYNIKSELEDLSLKYNNPEVYNEITEKLELAKESRERYIEEFKTEASERLKEEGLNFTIKGRAKAISSIYRKMLKQGVSFEEVFDNYAIRIIYKSDAKNEKFLAWKIYSIVTDVYHSNPSRMRDWITQPRSTGYESLHLTVLGPDKKWIEVQIRSERMDEIAEKGVAAHYKYKEGYKQSSDDRNFEKWVTEIREVLEQQQNLSTSELLDNIKLNLYSKEVFVFTPKGEIKILPTNATALDFAFSVHSDLGMKCLGAKINGKLVPISYVLQNGDQIDILSSQNQKPKSDWLEFVVTSKAKSKIKSYLNSQKNQLVEEGKEILQRKLRHAKINFNDEEINKLQKFFNLKTSQDLFLKFQSNELDVSSLRKYIESKNVFNNLLSRFRKSPTKNQHFEEPKEQNLDMIIFGKDEEKLNYSYAKCCTVIPGDKIFGFITISDGIKVHSDNCPNAINLRAQYDYRVIPAKWVNAESFKNRVKIEIEGLDRMGMINDITTVISGSMGMDMKSMSIESNNGIFTGNINLEVKNKGQLEETFKKLKSIDGVSIVRRLQS